MLNRIVLIGRLTKDPELKYTPAKGTAVATFTLAVNRRFSQQGQQREADFVPIVVWQAQAENCAKFLTKGSSAYVEGRLQTRSWDKDGQKQYRTEVIADRVQFGPRGGSTGGNTPAAAPTGAQSSGAPVLPDYPEEEINPEDIPF